MFLKILRKIKNKINTYYLYYFKRYNYFDGKYPNTFLSNFSKEKNIQLDNAPEIIYTFWTGNNPLTPNRKKGLESLIKYSEVKVQLITPNNLPDYTKKEHPLHPAYEYLSLNHRSDYLRAYFMYYYGGGYADIKYFNKSWKSAFNKLNKSQNKYCIGYYESGIGGVADVEGKLGKDMKRYFLYLIGNGSYIFKPYNPISKESLKEIENRLDFFYENLKKNRATDFFGQNENYPIPWNYIGGHILHQLELKYYDNILHSKNVKFVKTDYR